MCLWWLTELPRGLLCLEIIISMKICTMIGVIAVEAVEECIVGMPKGCETGRSFQPAGADEQNGQEAVKRCIDCIFR